MADENEPQSLKRGIGEHGGDRKSEHVNQDRSSTLIGNKRDNEYYTARINRERPRLRSPYSRKDIVMPRTSKKTQAPQESFAAVAERLGNALADVAAHPNCPEDVFNAIVELDTNVFNRFPDVEVSLRYSFPKRLVGALESRA